MNIFKLAFLMLLCQFSIACNQAVEFPQASQLPDSMQNQKRDKTGAANIVFKSTDGGKTWQDMSDGLPVPVKDDNGGGRNVFFADDNGLCVITHWLKTHHLRQVQYMAGHKYVSSTQRYQVSNLDELQNQLQQHHSMS